MNVLVMNMSIRLNIFNVSSQHMFEDEYECSFIDVIEEIIEEALLDILTCDSFGTYLSHRDLKLSDLGSTIDEMDSTLDSAPHLESSSYVYLWVYPTFGKFSYAIFYCILT